jgi:predicted metal-dependent hydrolase
VGIGIDRLDSVVRGKAQWIAERVRANRGNAGSLPMREFVGGETFLYLGRQYRLRVVPGEAGDVVLRGGWLFVPSERNLSDQGRAKQVRAALERWYREHALLRLPARIAWWSEKVGVSEPRMLVREQQKRWASCDARGVLRVNWRIIQASMRLVDYVLAHELVHLRHADHGHDFWALLGRVMPDYEERREALRVIGPRLVW